MNLVTFLILTILTSFNANAEDGITSNHQVNPPHFFKQLICVEEENDGRGGYTIIIDVPNGRDAEAKVYFNRPGAPRSFVSLWQVKYIIDPGVYAVFANQFQGMDISRGPEDQFSLSFQLHSGLDEHDAKFESPSLLGVTTRNSGMVINNRKSMDCSFQ